MSDLIKVITAAGLLALAGCGGSSNDRGDSNIVPPEPPTPAPETSLDETGVYRGTLETSEGDVALVSVLLSRDGTTVIAVETDDSERPTIILQGESSGDAGALDFEGTDTRDGSSVALDIGFDGEDASGNLNLNGLAGDYALQRAASSDSAGTVAAIVGSYAREDSASGGSELDIADDGGVSFSGECAASGTVSTSDDTVNVYQLQLSGDCIDLDVLLTREDLIGEGDVLVLVGSDGDAGFASQFYRQ